MGLDIVDVIVCVWGNSIILTNEMYISLKKKHYFHF